MRLLYFVLGVLLLVACQDSNYSEIKEPVAPGELTVEPESVTLAVGESCQLVAKLNGVPLEKGQVSWESNTDLVNVDDNGRITAIYYSKFISGLNVKAEMPNGQYAVCKITLYPVYDYKLRLILKDKGNADYSLNQPEMFLSSKAIERRRKRNIAIDDLDLPISKEYLKQIEELGGKIVCQSKWLKTICVQCEDESLVEEYIAKYKELPFVEEVVKVWKGERNNKVKGSFSAKLPKSENSLGHSLEDYGDSWRNIALHNGQVLHERGFEGSGIDIAVIDGGFNVLDNPTLNNIGIQGAKSFVYEDANPYNADEHGVWVLSCMATNRPGYYVGTAPKANYWLLRSEDSSESGDYPVEEDYWVSAMEYADSAGVDIVNTSLYYIKNQEPFPSHKFEEMDGKTALPTRAANIAANKGIFVVCCAGNDGSWVGTPADSPNVLTVGSVNATGGVGTYTAYGVTVDGRMKPDVMSLGQNACIIDIDGNVGYRSGTSYASPILCGLAACLWQAYPSLTNRELLDLFRKSANRYNAPELPYGYGIVDIRKAIELIDAKLIN